MLVPANVKEKTRIRFENNQCIVDGRSFSTEHVVLVSPSNAKLVLNEDGIKLEASYDQHPKFSTYGNYIVIGVSSDRYIPTWDTLEGKVVKVDEHGGSAEGELGIRASLSRGYVVVELIGSDKKPTKFYVKEVNLEAEKPDFVNVLGSRFHTFYVKTRKDSKVDIKKEDDKLFISISSSEE
ncbi:hypothetical protein [Ignicoccus hospitalis]|uniref:Uncharacterized protein n=1 Tax=Ignicoccus hospitalis (strain KIN4/I / DSM 18386 / JCM 14125) TaxID=453591 RepID=A8A8U6_IGNH4|nr:hypothetical protein [Ignicoccus hospitalis]ABU81348.1 hypothetical protein Igni_0164 [Ignicoccus hospitalis KIN4/I]HIH90348.1 hypothetical protein [Desulfurococcaceae archaeon]